MVGHRKAGVARCQKWPDGLTGALPIGGQPNRLPVRFIGAQSYIAPVRARAKWALGAFMRIRSEVCDDCKKYNNSQAFLGASAAGVRVGIGGSIRGGAIGSGNREQQDDEPRNRRGCAEGGLQRLGA